MSSPAPRPRPQIAPLVIAAFALVTAALLLGHRMVPGGAGTMLDSVLPWLGLMIPILALAAFTLRSGSAAIVLLVPTVVWSVMFGTSYVRSPSHAPHDLRVVSQNIYAQNPRPGDTAARLVATHADLIAVEELPYGRDAAALQTLAHAYPDHITLGTVGLWSRWPLANTDPVDLGLGWTRALRATVHSPKGDLTVYVAHLGSARPDETTSRDATLKHLATAIHADPSPHLLVLGDLNTATTDRAMSNLIPPLQEAQQTAGVGLGFTWPSTLPITRPDHVLYRGLHAINASVLQTPGTDHRAVQADFSL